MTTSLTPRFTLPDPDRPRAPALPAEIVLKIVKLAQEGDSPIEQLRTKLRIELVCKDWFLVEYRWREMVVAGEAQLELLMFRWSGEVVARVARRVKSISLKLDGTSPPLSSVDVNAFFGCFVEVEEVDLVICGERRLVCLELLAALDKLKRVTITTDPKHPSSAHYLKQLFAHWPKLELLTLKHCFIRHAADVNGLFACNERLKMFSFTGDKSFLEMNAQEPLLLQLPTNLRMLHALESCVYFGPPEHSVFNSSSVLLNIARNLTHFILVDVRGKQFVRGRFRRISSARGHLDRFVVHLDRVHHLTLSACALTDLTSLVALTKLTHLQVHVGAHTPKPAVEPSELIDLIANSRSLKEVLLSRAIAKGWSSRQKRQVEEVAEKQKVNFVWKGLRD